MTERRTWEELRSWFAIGISVLALFLSGWTAWTTSLRPGQLTGDLSYLVIWRFSSSDNGVVTDVAVAPALWLQNIGARPIVVKDLRMILLPKNQHEILSFPVSSVPIAAIEASAEFNEYGRLSTGSPFRSFALTASQVWQSEYKFNISSDSLSELVGDVGIQLQVVTNESPNWKTVLQDSLDFGAKPFHMQPVLGSAQGIPVYTRRWSLRQN